MTKNEIDILRKCIHCCTVCALRGRLVISVEVHHINGNHQNDNPANLTVLCRLCHEKAHNDLELVTTMSRKMTPADLRHYRDLWINSCKNFQEKISFEPPQDIKSEQVEALRNSLKYELDLIKTDIIEIKDILTKDKGVELKPKIIKLERYENFLGNARAPVTIIEYGDFQCPFSKRFAIETFQLIKTNYIDPGKVKFTFRHFPLSSIHPFASLAAEAAECAKEQGKFWEFHDILFKYQELVNIKMLKDWASELKLDMEQFNSSFHSEKYKIKVEKDFEGGAVIGVGGTPSFYINGVELVGAQPFSVFKQIIDNVLINQQK